LELLQLRSRSGGGVPQKTKLGEGGGEETAGFQRELNSTRLKKLASFFKEDKNTIQNPLLCAARATRRGSVSFKEDDDNTKEENLQSGTLVIEAVSSRQSSISDLLSEMKCHLEERIPTLLENPKPTKRMDQLRAFAVELGELPEVEEEDSADEDENDNSAETEGDTAEAFVFSEESYIALFYDEIVARLELLNELDNTENLTEFLGYEVDALDSFLRPIVIVDGQHRLEGAIQHSKDAAGEDEHTREIARLMDECGFDARRAQHEVEKKLSKQLPISLLLEEDPAEHVFQFVVVNQKATPIGKALLGTIVSTSLSEEEKERVSDRLVNADIPLLESRSVAFLTRDPESPFHMRVERGFSSDEKDLLPWSVLASLIRVFQHLNGGKLYHERSNDYANEWKMNCLENSPIANSFDTDKFATVFDYWSSPSGPWREVCMKFFCEIRDFFGSTTDKEAHNYWGSPRSSNLFNKVSLTILAADFFKWLNEQDQAISSVNDVPDLVRKWLKQDRDRSKVDAGYFNRDWSLTGVKKDSTGIRKQWAKIWSEYRGAPVRLPVSAGYKRVFQ